MKLNLGSGEDYQTGYINVDLYASNANMKFDLNKIPYPFIDSSIDEILMKHTLEHLDKPINVVNEMIRICKSGAKLIIEVPHYNHSAAVEAAHKTFFNDTWFNYWIPTNEHQKNYPRNGTLKLIKIIQKPTILGYCVPFSRLRMFLTKVLNVPLIFSLTFILEVNKNDGKTIISGHRKNKGKSSII